MWEMFESQSIMGGKNPDDHPADCPLSTVAHLNTNRSRSLSLLRSDIAGDEAAMVLLSLGPPDVGVCGDISSPRAMPRSFLQVDTGDGTVANIEPSRNGGLVAKTAALVPV